MPSYEVIATAVTVVVICVFMVVISAAVLWVSAQRERRLREALRLSVNDVHLSCILVLPC